MRHGVPVLTSDADASSETNLDGETGFAVSRDDLGAVAARIVSVLKDERLYAHLSRNAFERWSRQFCFSAFQRRFLAAAATAGLIEPIAAHG
jgi:glycosyltransferase involved in cell wall biosynthesis